MTSAATHETIQSVEPVAHRGPVIVATDGTTACDAAIRCAGAYGAITGMTVRVVTVLEPAPIVAAEHGILLPPPETETARKNAQLERVKSQLRELLGPTVRWSPDLKYGDPASVLAFAARELDAQLLIMGLGRHDLMDRIFGSETALHALRRSRSPVFLVPPSFRHLPKRIVIATDFSGASLAAGRAALALLPGIESVSIVHVVPRLELQPEAYAAWMGEYASGVGPAFAAFQRGLAAPHSVNVETVTLNGRAPRAILDFVKAAHVDAIVTGSRGNSFLDRILVGSTATALVRAAQCAIFALPTPLGLYPRSLGPTPDHLLPSDWASGLDEFTRKNAGRRATLEVDDPDLGAQAVQQGYRFLGAAYDRHDGRIELMLGEATSTQHFTRGISLPTSVDILHDQEGRDTVLRIAHGVGQTILTLERSSRPPAS